MDLDDLRLLVLAVDMGSIAAAARAVRISPSLASRRISGLEQQAGSRLLLRTTRSLVTTEAGALLVTWARGAVADQARIRDEIGSIQGQATGLVRLATNDYAASTYIPPILARFAESQPEVRVAVSIVQEPARLLDDLCDVAIHAGRRPAADLIGRRIYEYPRRIVAAPSYLARRDAPQSPADLAHHRCLTHAVSEPSEWCFEDQDGRLLSQPIQFHLAADSWTMLSALTLQGAGIARLADVIVRDALNDGRLVELIPDFRCVYSDGDQPAMWVLLAQRNPPFRTRLLADHFTEELLRLHRTSSTASRAGSARPQGQSAG